MEMEVAQPEVKAAPDYSQVMERARSAFASGKTKCLKFRKEQLLNLMKMLEENEAEILRALKMDMRKSWFEGQLGEIENCKNELRIITRGMRKFAADDKLPLNLLAFLDKGYVRKEPFGVVLILGTWNYPFNLSLTPLFGAVAAGNCLILKPSEIAPNSAEAMARLLPRYIDADCYQVVLGGVEETQTLLRQRFDYIFYTGSANVGKRIAAAAAVHLTPTTLELGGKSPCYVDTDADFHLATKRILWGKVMNLGMTCIAPDYILCSKEAEKTFIQVAQTVMQEWYGESLQKCEDLPRIPNTKHFKYLKGLLDSTHGRIAYGGTCDAGDLWIEPTIVVGVDGNDPLMEPSSEIFGPILPIVNVDSVEEAISFINSRPKALALYAFSRNESVSRKLIEGTSSGGVCINDVIWHNLWPGLPFGGVGDSGYGNYHGKYSFDTFSHKRAVLHRGFSYASEKLGSARYPPYTRDKLSFFIFIINYFETFNLNCEIGWSHAIAALIGAGLLFLVLYNLNVLLI